MRGVNAKVAELSLDALTHTELLDLLHRREVVTRSLPTVEDQIISRLAAEADPKALGGTSLADVMATKLGISKQEANRRIKRAELLGPRRAITGEPLAPKLPNVAAAQARGQIGPEHVRIIEKFFDDLPGHIDWQTRDQVEADLARIATDLGPMQFRQAADRLALLLNQDGDPPDEAERARRRFLSIEKQGIDGNSRIHGLLDPEARATIEAVFAKWAAPGMCNPEDENPCADGEPTGEAQHGDMRSQGQRNHDALKAMGRSVLASGELGKHNGLPCTIIVSTTLQDLQSAAGVAVTADGMLLPMRDVIRLASQSNHYLVIYDNTLANRSIAVAPNASPRPVNASFSMHSSAAALVLVAPRRPAGAKCTTSTAGPMMTGPPTSPNSPWPAGLTTAWSKTVAGPRGNAKTAAPNGSHHRTSTEGSHG
jgi:hypothetical protein